jgi:hypothetical protein
MEAAQLRQTPPKVGVKSMGGKRRSEQAQKRLEAEGRRQPREIQCTAEGEGAGSRRMIRVVLNHISTEKETGIRCQREC